MIIFKSKVKGLHVWNPKKNRMLCQFQDGLYETEDEYEIGLLDNVPSVERVDGKAPKAKKAETAPLPDIPVEDMSVPQLKKFAKVKGIQIPSSKRSKVMILDHVLAEIESAEVDSPADQE